MCSHSNCENLPMALPRDGRHRMARQVRGIMIHTLYQYICFLLILYEKESLMAGDGDRGRLSVIPNVTCLFL